MCFDVSLSPGVNSACITHVSRAANSDNKTAAPLCLEDIVAEYPSYAHGLAFCLLQVWLAPGMACGSLWENLVMIRFLGSFW